MKRKKSDDEFNFKELMSNPRGKALLFFGAYLVFFIVIGIIARTGDVTDGANDKKYDTGSPLQFSLSGIEKENYKFTYKLEVDGNVSTIMGIRNGAREKASCTGLNQFYMENDNYFVNSNGVWIKTNSPYLYEAFYDVENIGELIENSKYISKTEYESGKDVYTFNISSATINMLFENADLDVEEISNEIVIEVDEDNLVTEVKFILDSYCKVKGMCMNGMKITLNYEMFGEIDEIASPLE